MTAALRDITLSTAILDVVRQVLPYTEPGVVMSDRQTHDLVLRLTAIMKLATLMEQELSVHRFAEAGLSPRALLEREIAAALDHNANSTVVKVDFDKGKKP